MPEAGEVTEDPGKLPEPDKVTKAYFEVRLRCIALLHSFPTWHLADAVSELAVLLHEACEADFLYASQPQHLQPQWAEGY